MTEQQRKSVSLSATAYQARRRAEKAAKDAGGTRDTELDAEAKAAEKAYTDTIDKSKRKAWIARNKKSALASINKKRKAPARKKRATKKKVTKKKATKRKTSKKKAAARKAAATKKKAPAKKATKRAMKKKAPARKKRAQATKPASTKKPEHVILGLCEICRGKALPFSQITDQLAEKAGSPSAKALEKMLRRQKGKGLITIGGKRGQQSVRFTKLCKERAYPGLIEAPPPPSTAPAAPADPREHVQKTRKAYVAARDTHRDALVTAIKDRLSTGKPIPCGTAYEIYQVLERLDAGKS